MWELLVRLASLEMIPVMRFPVKNTGTKFILTVVACVSVLTSIAAIDAKSVVAVTESEQIEAALDNEITIEGRIERIGESKTRSILFVNFEGLERGGFTVIIRQGTLAGDYVKFDPEFGAGLIGRTVRITGTISSYKGGFQMQVFAPGQIEFIDTEVES